jgi:DinB superfamily
LTVDGWWLTMTAPNPYAPDLGDLDPVASLAATPDRYVALLGGWTPAQFERTYAPGKWTARQVLIHLAQAELMIQPRVRLALTARDYVVQPFEQDDVLALEPDVDAATALGMYRSLRQFSLPLIRSLTPAQLAVACTHPQMGVLDVRWFLVMLAGHELRHLRQLQQITG